MTLAGGPATSPPPIDLSGPWNARVLKDGIVFREIFSLTPSVLDLANLYDLVDGEGPSYSTTGCLLVFSSGNKIAVEIQEEPGGTVRNVSRPLNLKRGTAVLIGWSDNLKSVQMNIAPQ